MSTLPTVDIIERVVKEKFKDEANLEIERLIKEFTKKMEAVSLDLASRLSVKVSQLVDRDLAGSSTTVRVEFDLRKDKP